MIALAACGGDDSSDTPPAPEGPRLAPPATVETAFKALYAGNGAKLCAVLTAESREAFGGAECATTLAGGAAGSRLVRVKITGSGTTRTALITERRKNGDATITRKLAVPLVQEDGAWRVDLNHLSQQ